MKLRYASLLLLVFATGALLATPILAGPGLGPKYEKYVAPLEDESDIRLGQAIFNTNPEDDGTYELEVEVEECMALADSTVDVVLDSATIGSLYIDEYGNGKDTFYVESISDTSLVEVDTTLTGHTWHLWVKAPGPK